MNPAARLCVLILLAAAGALLCGCGGTGGRLTLRSVATGAAYEPALPTAVYRYQDLNTADVYLSDIPMEALANPDVDLRQWAAAEGGATLVHIHLFVLPKAGKTPIDATACNATLRQLILAPVPAGGDGSPGRAAAGLYGGGGFVLPGRGFFGGQDKPGGDTLSGSISRGKGYGEVGGEGLGLGGDTGETGGGTLRLIRAGPGFADPIGAAELSGRFTAVLDEPLADVMAARLEGLIMSIPVVEAAPEAEALPEREADVIEVK